jgi:hypothetical protein
MLALTGFLLVQFFGVGGEEMAEPMLAEERLLPNLIIPSYHQVLTS